MFYTTQEETMITIKEIANLAGVSKSTVSRVINNSGYVSHEKKEQIEKIIKEHNYQPSAAAVSLSRKESNTIGVIIPEIDNQFFGEVIKGITEEADKNDFSLICFDTQNDGEKELKALSTLAQHRVRGIIITPALGYEDMESVEKLRDALEKIKVPVVVVDRDFNYSHLDTVYFQNYESGYLATESLIKAGNKRIGIIQGDMNLKIARERFRGYKDAMSDHKLEIKTSDILEGNFSKTIAYKLTCEMIKAGDMPEAIVTSNNRTTIGFIKALTENNLKIGEDVAIVGIDRIEMLEDLGFDFSYISRDNEEMGRLGIRMLLNREENPDAQRALWIVPCSVVLNGSENKNK
jgi:LacI family transcriptional regulator